MSQNGTQYTPEMISLLVDALGGQAQVEKIFNQKRVASVMKSSTTIGEALSAAQEQGWIESFRAMTLGEIASKIGGKGVSAKRTGGRLTKDEVTALYNKTLAFLQAHPGSKVGDIASFAGVDSLKAAVQIRKLVAEGKVRSEGAKAKTVYFIK